MEPIRVPAPPKSAFNKHRRVSDLIRKQVNHFKHLEHKLPDDVRSRIPQHHIVTEEDAARYIAPMTALLLSQPVAAQQPSPAVTIAAKKGAKAAAQTLSLAAAAEPSGKAPSGMKEAAGGARKGNKK